VVSIEGGAAVLVSAYTQVTELSPDAHACLTLRICRQYVPPGIRLAGEMDFLAAGQHGCRR
jgi:hypothetical protein